jgi:hypothetical protein
MRSSTCRYRKPVALEGMLYFTFWKILNKLMTRLVQYMSKPKNTRHTSATWSLHIVSPALRGSLLVAGGDGGGSSSYHDSREWRAHGMGEVK